MRVAIKYCGGCNPRYDRVACANELKKTMDDLKISYVPYKEDEQFDGCLLVSGCSRSCLTDKQFTNCRNVYQISDAEGILDIKMKLHEQVKLDMHAE